MLHFRAKSLKRTYLGWDQEGPGEGHERGDQELRRSQTEPDLPVFPTNKLNKCHVKDLYKLHTS